MPPNREGATGPDICADLQRAIWKSMATFRRLNPKASRERVRLAVLQYIRETDTQAFAFLIAQRSMFNVKDANDTIDPVLAYHMQYGQTRARAINEAITVMHLYRARDGCWLRTI